MEGSNILSVAVVDDEAPARLRLRALIEEFSAAEGIRLGWEAASGEEALARQKASPADVLLLDIRMPGMDGLMAARHLLRLQSAPGVVFVTAFDQHAIEAFEIGAIDYLLKPVRGERLLTALRRARRLTAVDDALLMARVGARTQLTVNERDRVLMLPLDEILFFRSEDKYVIAQTASKAHLLDESLVRLEEEFDGSFIRIHRNCLVARRHLAGFELVRGEGTEAHWAAVIRGWPERLPVSRRQAQAVRAFREQNG